MFNLFLLATIQIAVFSNQVIAAPDASHGYYDGKAAGFYGGASQPSQGHFDRSQILAGQNCFNSQLLLRGGAPQYQKAKDKVIEKLVNNQVAVLVDLRTERSEKDRLAQNDLVTNKILEQVVHVPMTTEARPDAKTNNPQLVLNSLKLVRTYLMHGKAVYIHCMHGEDRTGEFIQMLRTSYGTQPCPDSDKEFRNYGGSRYSSLQKLKQQVHDLNVINTFVQ